MRFLFSSLKRLLALLLNVRKTCKNHSNESGKKSTWFVELQACTFANYSSKNVRACC